MAGSANGAFGWDINIISIFGARVGTKVNGRNAFVCEFGVLRLFEKGLDWAAPNAKERNVRAIAGELLERG
jgi:hypothetical protein